MIFFLVSAYLGGELGDALISHAGESQQKNADLTLLLEASLVVSSSSDLSKAIPELAQKILNGLPASFVRVDLLEGEKVNCYGLAYQRPSYRSRDEVFGEFFIQDSLIYKRLLAKPQITLYAFDQLQFEDEQLSFLGLFPSEIKNCCLVPLITDQKVVGILAVGEARDSEREFFDVNKLDFLGTLANQLAVVIENVRLHQAERQKAKRLEILYEIANVFGSTIEMGELLERLYGLLIQVIPADTYFVGFLDKNTQMVDIQLLIDDGKRFEAERVPLSEGLIGYVVRTQKPLFIRSMREQWGDLPVKPLELGQAKMSESWMGVPLGKDEHLNGILAVASYQPSVFTEEDFSLLINVAQQAKLAFDNARHHADVEEQALHDSLTGALNHRAFLEKLDSLIEEARHKDYPLSLIMLDVDFFKEYNDNYGHVFGDEILRLAVQTIQNHLKRKDMVGRWGGEEFGVVIVGATLDEACQVARRIRETLSEIILKNETNQVIPAPTVSQGIACFPDQAQDAYDLVEKADQALYLAKSAGRDQI
ncbi:MAG: diguanylate cyclase, partial [Anaerolineales bacterium]